MIRFATEADIPAIMQFIRQKWREDHILATDEFFFRYEHLIDGEVTFVIAEENGKVTGTLGYIPYAKTHRDIMTVMWKATHTDNPMLGVELLLYLKEHADVRIMASPGSNPKTASIYHYLGWPFGKMRHWYRLAPREAYRIAQVTNRRIPEIRPKSDGELSFSQYRSWEEAERQFDFAAYERSSPKPYKETWYLKKRYFRHPVYAYEVYGVGKQGEKARLMLVFRKEEKETRVALRLIDCIGDCSYLAKAGELFDALMTDTSAEYIDCYEYGLPDNLMSDAGMLQVENSDNIIPDHFAPYEAKNVELHYFTTDPDVVLFKGDGDQDRPNCRRDSA